VIFVEQPADSPLPVFAAPSQSVAVTS